VHTSPYIAKRLYHRFTIVTTWYNHIFSQLVGFSLPRLSNLGSWTIQSKNNFKIAVRAQNVQEKAPMIYLIGMKNSQRGEVAKVLVLYGVFAFLAIPLIGILMAVGLSCDADYQAYCKILAGRWFVYLYILLPSVIYLLLRLKNGCSWKKVGVTALVVFILGAIPLALYGYRVCSGPPHLPKDPVCIFQ